MLGYSRLALGAAGQLKELTEEQARWEKQRNKSLEAYANTLGRINHQWDEISKLLSGPIFSENSPLVRGAKALEAVLTNAKDMLEFIKRGGFDVIMHPLDPEARQRSIDAVKELQHERHERMTPEERAAEHAAEEKAKAAAEANAQANGRSDGASAQGHAAAVFQRQRRRRHLRRTWPESSNIEDRRGEFDDRAKYMKENTAELKRLNDFLIGGLRRRRRPGGVGGYGFLSGGAGGGGGFASRLGLGPGGARRHQHWRVPLSVAQAQALAPAGWCWCGCRQLLGWAVQPAPRNQRWRGAVSKAASPSSSKTRSQGLPPDAAAVRDQRRARRKTWARFGVSVAHA